MTADSAGWRPSERYPDPAVEVLDPSFGKYRIFSAAVERLACDPKLRHYHLLMAARGQLLAKLGRTSEAAKSFQAAIECACSEPERRFLRKKLEACASDC